LTAEDEAVIGELYHLWSVEAGRIWHGASETEIPVLDTVFLREAKEVGWKSGM
jgi:hypothetical protein